MKPLFVFLLTLVSGNCGAGLLAANLDRAVITEVVNHVRVIDVSTKARRAARVNEEFRAPNVLRTGADSRAEMVAADHTVTRVGSNTVFSFQRDSREMNLERGSVLFQSPSGRGGGVIHTAAASAAVLGTTMIVSATKAGTMKVMLLEGKGKVTVPDGKSVTLRAGQLAMVLPGGRLGPIFDFQLAMQVSASRLVGNFRAPLPSAPKITEQVRMQDRKIRNGELGPQQNQPPPRKGDRSGNNNQPPPPPPPRQTAQQAGPFMNPAAPQPTAPARDVLRERNQTPPPPPPPPPPKTQQR